jgi:hypothetical protein
MHLVGVLSRELVHDVDPTVAQHVLVPVEEVLLWTAEGHVQVFLIVLRVACDSPNADW